MAHLFVSLWPLFDIILAGYAMRKTGFPNEAFWPGADRLNYFILFPALLFKNLATAPLNNPALPRIALCVVLVLGLAWGALQMMRRCLQWKPDRFGVFVQGTLRFNTYIGLATVGSIWGHDGLTLVALLLAITIPAVNVLSVYAFTSANASRMSSQALLILKNPLILACLAGVITNVSGVPLSGGAENVFSLLSACSLPLGLLCVGAALQPQELHGEIGALAFSSIVRLLLVPFIAYGLVRVMDLSGMEGGIVVLFFALPTAPTAYVLARQLGGDAHLMAGIITLQTFLSAITLPLLLHAVL